MVFVVNEFITLKLENGKSNIYVLNQLFNHCKYLIVSTNVEAIEDLSKIESIDELAEETDYTKKNNGELKIPENLLNNNFVFKFKIKLI